MLFRSGNVDKHFVDNFIYYAEICFKEFGDLVKNWFTFNEVWCMSILNDFKERDKGAKPYKIAHNALLAHGYTVKLYREKYNTDKRGKIGIVFNSTMMYPKFYTLLDILAAERGMIYSLAWIADPIFKGDYPAEMKRRAGNRLPTFTKEEKVILKGSSDFFAINHYFSETCMPGPFIIGYDYWSDRNVITSYRFFWKRTHSGWPIVPYGLHDLIVYIHKRWTKNTLIPIWITENGIAVNESTVKESLNDIERINFHKDYIKAMEQAVNEHINVGA